VPLFLALTLALALAPAPASAWSAQTWQSVAADAARLAPPDLARQLFKHAGELAAGAAEPVATGRRAGLAAEVADAIEAIRDHRPFAEVARRLGRVTRLAAELSDPLSSSSADPEEDRYRDDYAAYAESARPRFAVVVYEWKPPVSRAADVAALEQEAAARGRRLYPLLGGEYRRIGFASGRERFDDRSSAFGLAALAYSHAVTDTARLFRYAWLAAGGADPRPVFAHARDRVLVLEQGGTR
jgi:hypothetical protein